MKTEEKIDRRLIALGKRALRQFDGKPTPNAVKWMKQQIRREPHKYPKLPLLTKPCIEAIGEAYQTSGVASVPEKPLQIAQESIAPERLLDALKILARISDATDLEKPMITDDFAVRFPDVAAMFNDQNPDGPFLDLVFISRRARRLLQQITPQSIN